MSDPSDYRVCSSSGPSSHASLSAARARAENLRASLHEAEALLFASETLANKHASSVAGSREVGSSLAGNVSELEMLRSHVQRDTARVAAMSAELDVRQQELHEERAKREVSARKERCSYGTRVARLVWW